MDTDGWITLNWRNLVWLIICLNKILKKGTKQMNEVQKKKTNKKTMECAFMLKRMGCAQGRKNAKSKYTQNTQNYKIQNLVLDK